MAETSSATGAKIALSLPTDTELVMTRMFDAPPRLVYEAWTQPDLVRQWWACMDGFEMTRCEIDLRVGGAYYFEMRGHGQVHGFKGVYRELVTGERVVMTQIYDKPGIDAESIVTMTFVARGEQTLFTSHTRYPSKEARDGHVASGMEHGTNIALDRLEQVVRAAGRRS